MAVRNEPELVSGMGRNTHITLGEAIWARGGGLKKLSRHGTAALLSAAHGDVDYPYTVAEVIALVQAGESDLLVEANELGCDIPYCNTSSLTASLRRGTEGGFLYVRPAGRTHSEV